MHTVRLGLQESCDNTTIKNTVNCFKDVVASWMISNLSEKISPRSKIFTKAKNKHEELLQCGLG